MEISRKTFLDILRLVDGDYDKADQICKLVEESTPMMPVSNQWQSGSYIGGGFVAPSVWNGLQQQETTWYVTTTTNVAPKKVTLNWLGKDPSKIWGITE